MENGCLSHFGKVQTMYCAEVAIFQPFWLSIRPKKMFLKTQMCPMRHFSKMGLRWEQLLQTSDRDAAAKTGEIGTGRTGTRFTGKFYVLENNWCVRFLRSGM